MNNFDYGSAAYWQEESKKAEMAFRLLSKATRYRCNEQQSYLEKQLQQANVEVYETAVNMCDNDLVIACQTIIDAYNSLIAIKEKYEEAKALEEELKGVR